jgi:hypothetical protein
MIGAAGRVNASRTTRGDEPSGYTSSADAFDVAAGAGVTVRVVDDAAGAPLRWGVGADVDPLEGVAPAGTGLLVSIRYSGLKW